MFKTFRFRLLVSYAAVVIFSLGLTALLIDRTLEKHAVDDLAASLTAQARLVESRLEPRALAKEDTAAADRLAKDLSARIGARITVITAAGRVLGDSEEPYAAMLKLENHGSRPEILGASEGSPARAVRRSATLDMDMLYLACPVMKDGRVSGYVRLALPLSSVKRTLSAIRRAIAAGSVASALFALLVGLWLLSALARPFDDVIYASKKFAAGDFRYRINVSATGELKKLSETLNSMAGDINAKMKELEYSRQELEAVFTSMAEVILVADTHGNISAVNSSAERLFGVKTEEAIGKSLLEVFRNAELGAIAAEAVSGRAPVSREIELVTPIKAVFRASASPIMENGRPAGSVVVAYDITDLRKLEAVRKDFVANVSHELRTPLTAVRGCIETLIDGGMDDKENRMDFLKTAEAHALRLETLISDLLNLSAIESGTSALEKAEVPVKELADRVHAGLAAPFAAKHIAFENLLPAALKACADARKLEQVFTNLLDNAVKYTGEGGKVTVSGSETGAFLEFSVRDSGIGIPGAHLPRIFERFYRVDKARSRDLGGTGLGLSIVKHIVELHGGSVGVESSEGLGSTFRFTLPR